MLRKFNKHFNIQTLNLQVFLQMYSLIELFNKTIIKFLLIILTKKLKKLDFLY